MDKQLGQTMWILGREQLKLAELLQAGGHCMFEPIYQLVAYFLCWLYVGMIEWLMSVLFSEFMSS